MSISTPNAISTPNTSPTITTDALIIGFGKGGKTLAAKLSAAGRKVVVAEASADMYGGTCINIGCLPSKSLILSAEQARRDGANSTPETREAAFEAAIKEKRRVTSMLRDKNYHKLADQDNITVITGRAHFTGPHSVEIATAEGPVAVTASKIFINTGVTPRIPDIPGIHTTPGVYTSTGLMDLDDMPQRLVIIGSGFIGLEFASMFADFGTAVTVLQHNAEFLPREDADVAAAIRAQLEAQGVKFLFNADTKAIAPAADGGVRLSVAVKGMTRGASQACDSTPAGTGNAHTDITGATDATGATDTTTTTSPTSNPTDHATMSHVQTKPSDDGEPRFAEPAEARFCLTTDAVLVATGRTPNVEGLHLEAAGVELTERGAVKVDELLRTTAADIWALGDVNGGPQHTYISLDDYRVVWSQLNGSDRPYTVKDRKHVPSSTFLATPYSRVGLNEREAKAAGLDYVVKRLPVAAVPKAQVMRRPDGLMKAIVERNTGRILGAMLLSVESHEVINIVKLAMDLDAPASTLRDMVFTHPTIAEALNDLFA